MQLNNCMVSRVTIQELDMEEQQQTSYENWNYETLWQFQFSSPVFPHI